MTGDMYYTSIVSLLLLSAFFLPLGAIASNVQELDYSTAEVLDVVYDYEKTRTYQVDGNSMAPLGFAHDTFVDVVPASNFNVGDVIAFTCSDEHCDGAYIKKISRKNGTCYWVEGRQDVWMEDGQKKQSMDSRTTYGWLCNDKITILGVASIQNA